MATTFIEQNKKLLRESPNIGIRVIVGTEIIMEFTKEDLISVHVSLRGAETKPIDPDFQASTIEIEAYYPGDTRDFLQYMGRDTIIQYKSSYQSNVWVSDSPTGSDDQKQQIGIRAFYTTFDTDTLTFSEHIVKIKATDTIGAFKGNSNTWDIVLFTAGSGSVTHDGVNYRKLSNIIKGYIGYKATHWGLFNPWSVGTPPEAYIPASQPDYRFTYYCPEMSIRKKLAMLMNIFMGTSPNDTDTNAALYKRLVIRDAGAPMMIWFNKMIDKTTYYTRYLQFQTANLSSKIYHDTWMCPIRDISYNEVSNLIYEYGQTVKKIYIDNPYVGRASRATVVTYELQSNMSTIISSEVPSSIRGYTLSGSTSQNPKVEFTQLGPTTFVLKCGSFTGDLDINVSYTEMKPLYTSTTTDPPDLSYNTGLEYGDEITYGPIYALRAVVGKSEDWNTDYNALYIRNMLAKSYAYNGLKQPIWITFTWRGHPGMQPRDIIRFTEKDGTQNYYEVDNLTLDHVDGGLSSTVKALLIRQV